MDRFSFPSLQPHEIVACMGELNIPITDEDLRKPNPATIRHIYIRLLELLTYITKEEMEQPHFDAIHVLEFPELHEESIPELAFSRNL
jgi:kinetochore protein Nuf2